ncbi:MAG TPA: ABC transporter permease subunit [Vicinamibacterales bacterium]|nr:ABC transporter permease subunit [Vicinamibacterales bacterium]
MDSDRGEGQENKPRSRWLLVVRHDVGLAFRRPSLHGCVAFLAILAGLSSSLGLRDVAAAHQDYTRLLQQQVEAQLEPGSVMGWSTDARLRVARPPELGAALAKGIDASLPSYWDFSPSGVRWGPARPSARHLQAGIPLDFGLLVLTIGGLLAGMYGVDIVASARATGTLRAWLSLPVPRALVLSAKLTAAALVVAYAVLVAQLAALAGLLTGKPVGLDVSVAEMLSLVAPMAVPALLFLCFMMILGMSVGLLVPSDGGAHLSQIALWILTALLIPYLTSTAARIIVPVPARGSLEHAASEAFATRIHDAEYDLGALLASRVDGAADSRALATAVERHRAALDDEWTEAAGQARLEVERIEQAWWTERRRQTALARSLSWLSPGAMLLRGFETLAGTGPPLAETWDRAVEGYQRRLNRDLFDERPRVTIRLPAQAGGYWLRFDRRRAPKLHEVPQFQVPRHDRGQRSGTAAQHMAGLAVYLMVIVGVASRLFATRFIRPTD